MGTDERALEQLFFYLDYLKGMRRMHYNQNRT